MAVLGLRGQSGGYQSGQQTGHHERLRQSGCAPPRDEWGGRAVRPCQTDARRQLTSRSRRRWLRPERRLRPTAGWLRRPERRLRPTAGWRRWRQLVERVVGVGINYPPCLTIDDERCECVRLRLQQFGSPSEGNSDKLRFRCDFSRYPTVAVSESRHSSLGLSHFLQTKASSECKTNAPSMTCACEMVMMAMMIVRGRRVRDQKLEIVDRAVSV